MFILTTLLAWLVACVSFGSAAPVEQSANNTILLVSSADGNLKLCTELIQGIGCVPLLTSTALVGSQGEVLCVGHLPRT